MSVEIKQLKVLLLREGSGWVAQCLDPDIAVQGSQMLDALNNLPKALEDSITLDEDHKLRGFPAPEWYWDTFKTAQLSKLPLFVRLVDSDEFSMRYEAYVEWRICNVENPACYRRSR